MKREPIEIDGVRWEALAVVADHIRNQRRAIEEMAEAYGEFEKGIEDPILCHYNGLRLHNAMEDLRALVIPGYTPNYEPKPAAQGCPSSTPIHERETMTNPVHNHLSITICEDAADAIAKGFDHHKNGTKPIEVKKVIIVRKGTEAGNPTVDFLLEDEDGQLFAFMVTGNLLKSIPC